MFTQSEKTHITKKAEGPSWWKSWSTLNVPTKNHSFSIVIEKESGAIDRAGEFIKKHKEVFESLAKK